MTTYTQIYRSPVLCFQMNAMVSLHVFVVPILVSVMTTSATITSTGQGERTVGEREVQGSDGGGFTELVGQMVSQMVELHAGCHLELLTTAPHSTLASSIIR